MTAAYRRPRIAWLALALVARAMAAAAVSEQRYSETGRVTAVDLTVELPEPGNGPAPAAGKPECSRPPGSRRSCRECAWASGASRDRRDPMCWASGSSASPPESGTARVGHRELVGAPLGGRISVSDRLFLDGEPGAVGIVVEHLATGEWGMDVVEVPER